MHHDGLGTALHRDRRMIASRLGLATLKLKALSVLARSMHQERLPVAINGPRGAGPSCSQPERRSGHNAPRRRAAEPRRTVQASTMATWWQGWWTLPDGRKVRELPPASSGASSAPPASGGGTGSGTSSACVRLDLGKLPSQVALRYGQAPGANMTPEDAVKRLAQAVTNMTLYSDMYERVVASDANVDGAR